MKKIKINKRRWKVDYYEFQILYLLFLLCWQRREKVVSRVNRPGNRRNKGSRLRRSSKAIPELLGTITNSVKLNPDMGGMGWWVNINNICGHCSFLIDLNRNFSLKKQNKTLLFTFPEAVLLLESFLWSFQG